MAATFYHPPVKSRCHGVAKKQSRRLVYNQKAKKYSVSNGQLSYKTKNGNEVTVIFSDEDRKRILKACHADPTAGHLGRTKTYYKVLNTNYSYSASTGVVCHAWIWGPITSRGVCDLQKASFLGGGIPLKQ